MRREHKTSKDWLGISTSPSALPLPTDTLRPWNERRVTILDTCHRQTIAWCRYAAQRTAPMPPTPRNVRLQEFSVEGPNMRFARLLASHHAKSGEAYGKHRGVAVGYLLRRRGDWLRRRGGCRCWEGGHDRGEPSVEY